MQGCTLEGFTGICWVQRVDRVEGLLRGLLEGGGAEIFGIVGLIQGCRGNILNPEP